MILTASTIDRAAQAINGDAYLNVEEKSLITSKLYGLL